MPEFRKELEQLINRHSMENGSNTPDWILADYLAGCLCLFDSTVNARARWCGAPDPEAQDPPGELAAQPAGPAPEARA
jgi:hypothetical protein